MFLKSAAKLQKTDEKRAVFTIFLLLK